MQPPEISINERGLDAIDPTSPHHPRNFQHRVQQYIRPRPIPPAPAKAGASIQRARFVHRGPGLRRGETYNGISAVTSRHSGLTATINLIFHVRCHSFICRSRVKADAKSG